MAEIECGNLMEQMMQAHHHLLQKNPEDDDVQKNPEDDDFTEAVQCISR